jgi:hypothetical protein
MKNNWRKVLSWEEQDNVSVILSVWTSDRGYVDREDGTLDDNKVENILYPKLAKRFLTTIKRILGRYSDLVEAHLDSHYDWDDSSEVIMFGGEVEGPRDLIMKLLVTGNSVWPTGNRQQAKEEIEDALTIYEK